MGRGIRAALSVASLILGLGQGGEAMAESDFTGVWTGPFGVMTLERDGERLIGTYTCCGDGVIEGTADGNQLAFRWRDTLNGSGEGRMALHEGGRTLGGRMTTKSDPKGEGIWTATRLVDRPDPPGRRTVWALTVVEKAPVGVEAQPVTAKGMAELFLDGGKVAGRLAGRALFDAFEMEVYNLADGTTAGDRMSLLCTNPYDGSTEPNEFFRDARSGVWTGTSASGTTTLVPLASGHAETLVEQAWARHARLWKLSRKTKPTHGDHGFSPVDGDPRFAAMARLNAGDAAGAEEAFSRLAEAYRAAGDTPHLTDAIHGRATALERLGRFEDARQAYQELLGIKGLDETNKMLAVVGLNSLQMKIGGKAGQELPQPPDTGKLADDDPIAIKDKAFEAGKRGDINAAVALYDRAIAAYEEERRTIAEETARATETETQRTAEGKPVFAERSKISGNAILLRSRNVSIAGAQQWIASWEAKRGRFDEAGRRLQRAVAVWREVDGGQQNVASTLGALSVMLQKQERLAEAKAAITEGIAVAEKDKQGERWRLDGQAARLAVRMDDNQAADTHFNKAKENIEKLRSRLVTEETKIAFFGREETEIAFFGRPAALYEDYVAFLMEHRKDPAAALEMAERSRARALLDALDPENTGLAAEYVFAGETASTTTSAPLTADAAVAMARADRVAYLVYFTTPRGSYAWLLTPDGRMHAGRLDADGDGLDKAITAFREAVTFGENTDASRRALTRLLDGPVGVELAALPKNTRLTVVPHKRIGLVPFAALGESLGAWGEQWDVTYLPSLSVASHLGREPVPRQGPLLAAGDPTGAKGLVASEEEIRKAAALFLRSTVLLGADATKASVLAELPRHRVALLSTHTRDIAHSAAGRELELQLAGKEGLAMADLRRGSLAGMTLVVLSACETVEGPRFAGDELMSLARAFLVAGAERVLVTLWKAEDRAATDIVPAFLAKVRDGATPAAALRHVMSRYRQDHRLRDGTPAKPATWGPWALVARHER